MAKYNKSEIMKAAWIIRRSDNVSMSVALKAAWANAKKPSKMAFVDRAEIDGYSFNLWEKHGLRRIYINNNTGRNKSNAGGCINLDNMDIVASGCVKSAARRFLDMYEVA